MRASGRGGAGSNQYTERGSAAARRRADVWEVEKTAAAFDPGSPMAGWAALGSTVDEVDAWGSLGFSASQAAFYLAVGADPGSAQRCRDRMSGPGLAPASELVARAGEHFAGMDLSDAVQWQRNGFVSAGEVRWWHDRLGAEPTHEKLRAEWLRAGFYIDEGEAEASEAVTARRAGGSGSPRWRYTAGSVAEARRSGVHDPALLARLRDRVDQLTLKTPSGGSAPHASEVGRWHTADVGLSFAVEAHRLIGKVPASVGGIVLAGWAEGARDPEAFVTERRTRWGDWNPWGAIFDAVGMHDMDEARVWHDHGITAWTAVYWQRTGITPSDLSAWSGVWRGSHVNVARYLYERGCTADGAALILNDLRDD